MSDNLTIEEVENKANLCGQYKYRLVLLQLAETMRDNERLREAINTTLNAIAAYPDNQHPMTASEVILRTAVLAYRNKESE